MEITTGMSAPPMGMMISTPRTKAIAVMTMNGNHCPSGPAKKNAQRRSRP